MLEYDVPIYGKQATTKMKNYVHEMHKKLTKYGGRPAPRVGKPVQLKKCTEHGKGPHVDWQPDCNDCVRAGLRSSAHYRSGKSKPAKMSYDIALYEQSGPYVAVGTILRTNGYPVFLAESIIQRIYEEIRRSLTAVVSQASFIWKTDPVN